MAFSQNGFPVLAQDSHTLHRWTIPTKQGEVKVWLRNGSAGFLLVHYALWYNDHIEHIYGRILDDWGWAFRPIRGQTSGYSNHASGTALDLNATKHPLGKVGTIVRRKAKLLTLRLRRWYRGLLRWGGNYHGRKDEMHVEVIGSLSSCERRARQLADTPRGRLILNHPDNRGQRKVIFS